MFVKITVKYDGGRTELSKEIKKQKKQNKKKTKTTTTTTTTTTTKNNIQLTIEPK